MVGKYEVTYKQKQVGTMDVTREGLYYCFRCQCTLPKDWIFRITASCGGRTENLGVLIPCNGQFYLETKRPVKLFENAVPAFAIKADNDKEDNWIPVREDSPFEHLNALGNGVLQRRDGVPGILFTAPAPAPQGSGPNP